MLSGVEFPGEETAVMLFMVWTSLREDSSYAHIRGVHLYNKWFGGIWMKSYGSHGEKLTQVVESLDGF